MLKTWPWSETKVAFSRSTRELADLVLFPPPAAGVEDLPDLLELVAKLLGAAGERMDPQHGLGPAVAPVVGRDDLRLDLGQLTAQLDLLMGVEALGAA